MKLLINELTYTMDVFNNRKLMKEYVKETIIGSGTFGTVYLVKLNGSPYAMKEINMNKLSTLEKQRAFNEVSLLAKLNHRYIIKYKDSSLDHITGKLLIVTDYADGGDLANAIAKQNGYPFNEKKIIFWFIQISLALQYIHSQNILHRDLKTQNIFLRRDNTIKVGDFGIARILGNSQDFANTGVGTPYYFSPEICMKKPYNNKSDMWALGCILFEISTLKHPFKADNFPQLMSLILEGKFEQFPSWGSDIAKQLVEVLLCIDPDKRPSTEEVLAYPPLQPYLTYYIHKSKESSPLKESFCRGPEGSCKRRASSALTSNSNCSKLPKLLPKTAETKQKPLSALTRVIPPVIVVTEYQTPEKIIENEKRGCFASTRVTPPANIIIDYKTKNKIVENERKPRSASIQAIPTAFAMPENKTQNKLMENESKPRSASTRAISPAIVLTSYKTENNCMPIRRLCTSLSPSEYKLANKVLSSKSVKEEKNTTYTIIKEKNYSTNLTKIPSVSPPNDIDCGYLSEEITCSADSTYNSICEYPLTNGKSEFTILKSEKHREEINQESHCSHQAQCHQCMIDMMWKNRIRSCVSVTKSNSDYLKLKRKLLVVFEPDLFQKVYDSLLNEWEGNEKNHSQASIRKYVKLLSYEQVQHLPLMIQLVQLDLVKQSNDETNYHSNELVML